ncbi:MAG: hypothetical protein HY360_12980 [Verrucomicrobia bacterium]|nr:hypothetical protein [Verrucomicrobiota bacterium]
MKVCSRLRGFSLFVFLFSFLPAFAASVKVAPAGDGKERIVMENDQLRLQVNPNRGARVESFRFAPWGATEIIQNKTQQGLLVDHFWQEYWPGQFWEAKYDYQVLANGPAEISVKFSCLSQDKGIPQVAGILLEKTITLKENDRIVKVSVRLTNQSSEGKHLGYWLQNICWLGGDKQGDRYFRPGKRGISQDSSDDANPPDAGFVREPQAGWTAAIDEKSLTGLVGFMDYNDLWFLYNCTVASTIEWQYDAVAIPPGKSWQTEVSLAPVSKLESVSYASERLLVGVTFKEDKAQGRLDVTQTYLAAASPLKSVEVQVALETLLSNPEPASAPWQRIANLAFEPQTIHAALPYDTGKRAPAVIRLAFKGIAANGDAFSESAELWYPGALIANTNPTDGSPFYSIKSPRKTKTLIKPDKIVRIVKDQPQVLFLKGFLSPAYKVESAIKKLSPAVKVKEGYVYHGVFGQQLDFFPYDYDALMSYDLVILGDLSAVCLGDAAIEMLKDYCERGGNLLVLGGPFAYGNGNYAATAMDDLLPVRSQGPFDLRPAGNEVKAAFPQAIMKPDAIRALRPEYLHQVRAKPDAKALMTCDASPLLVVWKYGGGNVCCVTGTPLGKYNFCDTQPWQEVLAYVLKDFGLNR